MTPSKAVTVTELNSYIKFLLDSDSNLQNIFVCGEISNFKRHSSGHLYFSLKDDKSVVRTVMFAGSAKNVSFDIADGMNVIVSGSVSNYTVSGQYQIYVKNIQPHGEGAVYLAFEKLKSKLLSEGLFDESLKKAIPRYPNKIGVVTSRTGAVIHDIKTVMGRRYPICEIVLYPVEVQGDRAPAQIVNGIQYFNKKGDVDAIIIGRGGGSLEELFAFNNENVARAVFASNLPVISAVGHETDVTICDFVADRRAATPSAAAEIAVPNKDVIYSYIETSRDKIIRIVKNNLSNFISQVQVLKSDLKSISLGIKVNLYEKKLEYIREKLFINFRNCIIKNISRYDLLKKSLNMCSPEVILKKGYAVVSKDGINIKSAEQIKEGMEAEIIFSKGKVKCKLTNVEVI